jgi:hypothetical protein
MEAAMGNPSIHGDFFHYHVQLNIFCGLHSASDGMVGAPGQSDLGLCREGEDGAPLLSDGSMEITSSMGQRRGIPWEVSINATFI